MRIPRQCDCLHRQALTMLDELQEVSGRLVVQGYRRAVERIGCAPTEKTTDKTIIAIYAKVSTAFCKAAEQRGETIPKLYLNSIVLEFFNVYEKLGATFLLEHLQKELNHYVAYGLRAAYKQELKLIDENSNDPDVIRLKRLQGLTKERPTNTVYAKPIANETQPKTSPEKAGVSSGLSSIGHKMESNSNEAQIISPPVVNPDVPAPRSWFLHPFIAATIWFACIAWAESIPNDSNMWAVAISATVVLGVTCYKTRHLWM